MLITILFIDCNYLGDPAILHKEIKEKKIIMANIVNYTTEELKELASICEIPVLRKSKVCAHVQQPFQS